MATTITGTGGVDKVEDGSIHEEDINADVARIGVNQTWQEAELTDTGALFTDGTPKYRAAGVVYTNNTDKPIQACITFGGGSANLTLNGLTDVAAGFFRSAVIPSGETYTTSGATISKWFELR